MEKYFNWHRSYYCHFIDYSILLEKEKMKLKKCSKCGEYGLGEKCRKCGGEMKDAHYKFVKLRDVVEKSSNI